MTTFEITIVMLLIAIVMLLIIAFIGGVVTINARMKEGFQYLGDKVEYCSAKLGYINGTAQSISQQLDNIEGNILDDLRDICPADKLDKTSLTGINSKLQSILDICNQQQNAWACDITSIVKHLNELTDIVDKMHRNLCVDIADKMVDRVYKQPTSVNGTPCYAPDGICTNPCMDCINCPKRGTGGTWSTSINTNKEE